MKARSIRFRLTVWYSVVLSLGLILFSAVVWLSMNHLLRKDLDDSLRNQSRGLEEYIDIEERDNLPRLPHEIDEYSKSMPFHHLLAVSRVSGEPIYLSDAGLQQWMANSLKTERKPLMRLMWQGRPYRGLTRVANLTGGEYRVFIALSSEAVDHAMRRLTILLLVIIPAFVVCGGGGGYLLSRHALAPVDRITEEAQSISVKNLAGRLAVPVTNDEIQRLAQTWNDMLARLEVAVSKISQFTADASHELRTPLAIIRLTAEKALWKTRPEAEYRHALQQIQNESESMTQLIEDLLFLARADTNSSAGQREFVNLAALADATCLELEPLALSKNIALNIRAEAPVSVAGNPSALRRMLIILLDNAIKYTPAGGEVAVVLREKDRQALLSVEDTGVGIPAEARRRIFERFFRVDTSRNKETGGYGLGLSIAQTIAEQHDGSIEMRPLSKGGSAFCVSLPVTGAA